MNNATTAQELVTCRPWEIFDEVVGPRLKLKKRTSRAWLIQWLTQQALAPAVGGPGPALLLLHVTARLAVTPGYAWISSRTLRALAGCNVKTLERHRRVLTAPRHLGDESFPPLFHIELVGGYARRGIHWWALAAGWRPFLLGLDQATRATMTTLQAVRQHGRDG